MNKKIATCLLMTLLLVGCRIAATSAAAYNWAPVSPPFDSICRILNGKNYDRNITDEDNAWVDQLDDMAAEKQSSVLLSRALYWRAVCNQMLWNPDSCIVLLEKSMALLNESQYDFDYAASAYQLAGNYFRIDRHFDTYQLLTKAIPIFEKHKDFFFLGNTYHLLALLFNDVNDRPMTIQYCELSKENYKKINYPLGKIYFLEAYLIESTERANEAIQLYMQAISENEDDITSVAQAYTNIAGRFISMKEYDSALYYVETGMEYLNQKKYGNALMYAFLLMNKANVYFYQDKYAEALDVLLQADSLSAIHRNEMHILALYNFLSKAYEGLGEKEKAFDYLSLYQRLYEERIGSEEKLDLQRVHARESINRQQDQINLLKKEAELKQSYIYIILLISIAVAIFIFMRMRVKKSENQRLQDSLENEKLITLINKENFEKDMEQKNREISSTILLLSNKNNVLQQINDITKKYMDEGVIPNSYMKKVNEVIGQSLKSDDEWDKLKMHFERVAPEFFTKLKGYSNELTENDLRLCAYIRIGIRAKEIAAMLAVHPNSINCNRYRLRKKFNLDNSESLDDFIRGI